MKQPSSILQKIGLIIGGIAFGIVIIEIVLRITGAVFNFVQEQNNRITSVSGANIRILCIGESTTVVGGQYAYPAQLERMLNTANLGAHVDVINKGISGARMVYILDLLEEYIKKYQPHLVIAMVGINDSGFHMPKKAVNGFDIFCERHIRTYMLAKYLWIRINLLFEKFSAIVHGKNKSLDQNEDYVEIIEEDQNTHQISHRKMTLVDAEQYSVDLVNKKTSDVRPYDYLGYRYYSKGNVIQSYQMFKKGVELDRENAERLVLLGNLCELLGRFDEALCAYEKASLIAPLYKDAFCGVARMYGAKQEYEKAEAAFKEALRIAPNAFEPLFDLGMLYKDTGRFAQAQECFLTAIRIYPNNPNAYWALGCLYRMQNKLDESRQMINAAMALDKENHLFYRTMAILNNEQKDRVQAEKYYDKAKMLQLKFYNPDFVQQYREFKNRLDKNKIPLVCVQYPMRSIESILRIFPHDKVIIVDNERLFKDAVFRNGYSTYFSDMFAGDFGHCTPEGNRLLARNIADVLLREYFHRP